MKMPHWEPQSIPRWRINPAIFIILLSALPQRLFSRALDAVDAFAKAVIVAPALRHDHLQGQPHDPSSFNFPRYRNTTPARTSWDN